MTAVERGWRFDWNNRSHQVGTTSELFAGLGLEPNTVRLDIFTGFPVSKAENRSRGGSVSQAH
jgi:hypothetical protein